MSVKHVQFNLKDCKSTQYYRLNTLIVLKVQMKWFLVAFIFQGLSNHLAMNRLAKNDKGLCWNYFGLKKHFYFTCITLCKVLPWALMISGTSPLPTTRGLLILILLLLMKVPIWILIDPVGKIYQSLQTLVYVYACVSVTQDNI